MSKETLDADVIVVGAGNAAASAALAVSARKQATRQERK